MILLINAVPIATVLKEIYIKYRFKMDFKLQYEIEQYPNLQFY